MRTTSAFFAGAGTVIVAIAAGLGGGLLLGEIMSPQQPKHPGSEVTRLEQRMSPQPIPATDGASRPVPYLAASQIAAAVAEPQSQEQSQPQVQQASTEPAEPSAARERSTPEDSYARVRDADVKREARRAEEKRKAERRQQWAEKRKLRQRQDDELRDVEDKVREVTEERPLFGTEPRFGTRRFWLFED